MRTSEVLNLTADTILRRGWTGGFADADPWGVGDDRSPVCLEGGLAAVIGNTLWGAAELAEFEACPAYRAMHAYLGLSKGDRIYRYNDRPGTTEGKVIEKLRACALIEEAKEDARLAPKVLVAA